MSEIETLFEKCLENEANLREFVEITPQFTDRRGHLFYLTENSLHFSDVDEEYSEEVYIKQDVDNLTFVEVYSYFGDGTYIAVFYKNDQITMETALELGWDI